MIDKLLSHLKTLNMEVSTVHKPKEQQKQFPANIHPKCISCGDLNCHFWFEGRTAMIIGGVPISVEGHVNRSMARRVVYNVGAQYIGVSIVVSPGFRSKEDLSKFLTDYKKTHRFEPLSFDLYYIHNCSIMPQLNGYFLPSDSLIHLFTSYNAHVYTKHQLMTQAQAQAQAQTQAYHMSMVMSIPSTPSLIPQPSEQEQNENKEEQCSQ